MITFLHTDFTDAGYRSLIVELDDEFVVRYPDLQHIFTPFNRMNESARVMVAYDQDTPVACGAFRPVDDQTIEIKRMYTRPVYRNRGIGKSVLRELEQWAKTEGFCVAILETGVNQPEAFAAYQKAGYVRIPNFPPYEKVAISICMRKDL